MFYANIAAHQEALRREIERLRKVYQQQNLKGVENGAPPPSSSEANNGSMEKEQLANWKRQRRGTSLSFQWLLLISQYSEVINDLLRTKFYSWHKKCWANSIKHWPKLLFSFFFLMTWRTFSSFSTQILALWIFFPHFWMFYWPNP